MHIKSWIMIPVVCLILTMSLFARPTQWHSRGIGAGGGLFACSISPDDADDAYILTDMSGVYHTTDFGQNWEFVNYHELIAHLATGVRYTSDPDILYSISRGYPNLLVKSTDHGRTFEPLPVDPTGGAYYLFADDQNTTRLVTTGYGGDIFFSTDGGGSWQSIYTFPDADDMTYHIAGIFWDGDNIYIATGAGLLVSSNGGTEFAFQDYASRGVPEDEGVITFAGSREGDITRLFAVTNSDFSPGWNGSVGSIINNYKGVYRLDYGDENWTQVAGNPIQETHIALFVGMARNNIQTVYLGGGDTDHWGISSVFKSIDGGNTWANVLLLPNNENTTTGWMGSGGDKDMSWGGYISGFAVAPNDVNRVFFGNLMICHGTTDGGASWKQMYVSQQDENPAGSPTPQKKAYHGIGLEQTSCWSICWHDQNNMFAGFADFNAVRSQDTGRTFSFNYNNFKYNSTNHFLKGPDGTLYASTSGVHDMYLSTRMGDYDGGVGAVAYSKTGGQSWSTLHNFNDNPVMMTAIDPNDPNTMYASVHSYSEGGIYVSHDIQNGTNSTWTKTSNPPRTEGHANNIRVLDDGALVCTYSVRKADGFQPSGGVFYSTDGGETWLDRSDPNMHYWTFDVVVDPNDPNQNTWYAGVRNTWASSGKTGGVGMGGLYKTTDRGQNWTRLIDIADFGGDGVFSCTFNPENPDELYVTTIGAGLLFSSNINADSPEFFNLYEFPFYLPTRVFFNPYDHNEIWVTTFGGGLWVSWLDETSAIFEQIGAVHPKEYTLFQNHPNPFNPQTLISYQLARYAQVKLEIYNIAGQLVANLVNGVQSAGIHSITWNGRNQNGTMETSGLYFYRLDAKYDKGRFTDVKKMLFVK